MISRWWFLVITIVVFIIYIVIVLYYFLLPTKQQLEQVNSVLDTTDRAIKGGCDTLLNNKNIELLATIPEEAKQYCREVLK